MRPIQLKAWDILEKKMLSLDDILSPDYIHDTCLLQHILPSPEKGYENYILMQFTGFLDKNGKEIYEGDIISCTPWVGSQRKKYEVKWDDILAWFAGDKHLVDTKDIEIIGNIYENENLL